MPAILRKAEDIKWEKIGNFFDIDDEALPGVKAVKEAQVAMITRNAGADPMSLLGRAENLLLPFIDWMHARLPAEAADPRRVRASRLISHRGEHDNLRVYENTMPAFDAAAAQGVWASSSTCAGPGTWSRWWSMTPTCGGCSAGTCGLATLRCRV